MGLVVRAEAPGTSVVVVAVPTPPSTSSSPRRRWLARFSLPTPGSIVVPFKIVYRLLLHSARTSLSLSALRQRLADGLPVVIFGAIQSALPPPSMSTSRTPSSHFFFSSCGCPS